MQRHFFPYSVLQRPISCAPVTIDGAPGQCMGPQWQLDNARMKPGAAVWTLFPSPLVSIRYLWLNCPPAKFYACACPSARLGEAALSQRLQPVRSDMLWPPEENYGNWWYCVVWRRSNIDRHSTATSTAFDSRRCSADFVKRTNRRKVDQLVC